MAGNLGRRRRSFLGTQFVGFMVVKFRSGLTRRGEAKRLATVIFSRPGSQGFFIKFRGGG